MEQYFDHLQPKERFNKKSLVGAFIFLSAFLNYYALPLFGQYYVMLIFALMLIVTPVFKKLLSLFIVSGILGLLARNFLLDVMFLEIWLVFLGSSIVFSMLIQIKRKKTAELLNFVFSYVNLIDSKDSQLFAHSYSVAYYGWMIARKLNLSTKKCNHIYLGGLMHDLGKIGISENILNKPSRLTVEEHEIIKTHPLVGYNALKPTKHLVGKVMTNIILYHHEHFDGKGYPYGLKGEDIPIEARIVALADSFHAMTSQRIYQDRKSLSEAINEIRENKGRHFDPLIADQFIEVLMTEEFKKFEAENGIVLHEKAIKFWNGRSTIKQSVKSII